MLLRKKLGGLKPKKKTSMTARSEGEFIWVGHSSQTRIRAKWSFFFHFYLAKVTVMYIIWKVVKSTLLKVILLKFLLQLFQLSCCRFFMASFGWSLIKQAPANKNLLFWSLAKQLHVFLAIKIANSSRRLVNHLVLICGSILVSISLHILKWTNPFLETWINS